MESNRPSPPSIRLEIVLYVLSLVGSLVSVAGTMFVKSEVGEMKILMLEKMDDAARNRFVGRFEYNALEQRMQQLERMHSQK